MFFKLCRVCILASLAIGLVVGTDKEGSIDKKTNTNAELNRDKKPDKENNIEMAANNDQTSATNTDLTSALITEPIDTNKNNTGSAENTVPVDNAKREGAFDADKFCQKITKFKATLGSIVTGSINAHNPCQFECKETKKSGSRPSLTSHPLPNYSSCKDGEKKGLCVTKGKVGACLLKDSEASKICEDIFKLPNVGEDSTNMCQAKCHVKGLQLSTSFKHNKHDGAECYTSGNFGTCESGTCKGYKK